MRKPKLARTPVSMDAMTFAPKRRKKEGARGASKKRRNPDEGSSSDESEEESGEPCENCGKRSEDLETVVCSQGGGCDEEQWCQDCVSETKNCEHCDKHVSEEAQVEVRVAGRNSTYAEEIWCCDCNSEASDCNWCSRLTADDDLVEVQDDGRYCPKCIEERCHQCPQCDDTLLSENSSTNTVHTSGTNHRATEEWCDSCNSNDTWECASCNNTFSDSVSDYDVVGEGKYCERCVDNHAERCAVCDLYYLSSDDHSHDPQTDEIESYHASKNRGFTPLDSPWIRRQPKPPVYFGVELEVEVINGPKPKYVQQVVDSLGGRGEDEFIAGIEADSSVRTGFEIVTNPAGLDLHRKYWLQADLSGLQSHNATVSCGLHVHMTRNAITPLTLGRMVAFANADANRTFMVTFCRRESPDYARFSPGRPVTYPYRTERRGTRLVPVRRYGTDRYEVFNLQNDETIEFRLPKGTTKLTTIIATVEFCNALIRFCETVSASTGLTVPNFKKFVAQDEMLADTRCLRAYLVDRGLASAKEMRLPKIPPPGTPPTPEGDARRNPRMNARMNPDEIREPRTYAEQFVLDYAQTGEWE